MLCDDRSASDPLLRRRSSNKAQYQLGAGCHSSKSLPKRFHSTEVRPPILPRGACRSPRTSRTAAGPYVSTRRPIGPLALLSNSLSFTRIGTKNLVAAIRYRAHDRARTCPPLPEERGPRKKAAPRFHALRSPPGRANPFEHFPCVGNRLEGRLRVSTRARPSARIGHVRPERDGAGPRRFLRQ